MKQRAIHYFGFLKTTAIGGVFFLLPLIVLGALLAQVAQIAVVAAKAIEGIIDIKKFGGFGMLIAVGFLIMIGLCFLAGLIARRSIARKFTGTVEKYLQIAFPRYAIVKDRLSGNLGGEHFQSGLKTIWVKGIDGTYRLGLEMERSPSDWITVYFPGAPDPWSGQVAIVPVASICQVQVDFMAAMTSMEKLGRDLQVVGRWQAAN